jgi:hypothetical protein
MSTIIDDILRRIAQYPQAHVEHDLTSVTYFPSDADGFMVRLTVEENTYGELYTVYYNGSHEEFTDRAGAILGFAFGLSTICRVREYSLSGRPFRWVVDAWIPDRGRWEADWDTVHWSQALALLMQRPTVRYLQNRLIDLQDGNVSYAA